MSKINKIKLFKSDKLCQDYIDNLYANISGYIEYTPKKKEQALQQKIFLTYGEILYNGINTLINNLSIKNTDVFYDLGSGVGKVVLQLFLNTNIKKAYGVEACEIRHNSAENIFSLVQRHHPKLFENHRELKSFYGNFLFHSIKDATIVFCDSLCFNTETLAVLGKILNNCNHLKYVISSKQIPLNLQLQKTLELDCSWNNHKTSCYLYSK